MKIGLSALAHPGTGIRASLAGTVPFSLLAASQTSVFSSAPGQKNLETRSHRPSDPRRWYSGLVSAPQPINSDDFPMPEVDANGVDLAQVRRMLALTPAERLHVLESALASMIKVRDGAQRAQAPRNPAAPR